MYGTRIFSAEQCYSVSSVDAVQKRGLDTVQVGGRWVPGEGLVAMEGRLSKRGGKVNDKTVHFALQNKGDVEADKRLVEADKGLVEADKADSGTESAMLRRTSAMSRPTSAMSRLTRAMSSPTSDLSASTSDLLGC